MKALALVALLLPALVSAQGVRTVPRRGWAVCADRSGARHWYYRFAARTNLLLQSEAIDSAAYTDSATPIVTANTWDFGLGSATGDTVNDDNGAASESRTQLYLTATPGPFTYSCFLQAGTTTSARMSVLITGGTGTTTCTFTDLTAVTKRKTCSATAGAGLTSVTVFMSPGTAASGTGTVKIGGCQLERGTVATPYIATAADAVTKAAGCYAFVPVAAP